MRHFKKSEFKCNCGKCNKGYADMDPALLFLLDEARHRAEIPFVISSAMRCKAYNTIVKGTAKSSHLTGYAVDIIVSNSRDRYKVILALMEIGFKRIGIGPDFIHIDADPEKDGKLIWNC